MNVSMNGVNDACVLEVNRHDAAVAAQIKGRLDSFNHCVRLSAGRQVAGFGVLVGFELPPRVMQQRSKEALRVVHLDLAAAQDDGQIVLTACQSQAGRRPCR